MKSDLEIEELLKSVGFQAEASAERALFAEADALMSPPKHRLWNWRRAAVIIVGAGAVMAVVSALFSRPELSLADVKNALAAQAWVHIKYDNDSEMWTCLSDGRSLSKWSGGRLVYIEPNGLRLVYWPRAGQYISKDRGLIGDAPPYTPQSAWDAVLGGLSQASTRPSSEVERHEDRINGRQVVRFDIFQETGWGNHLLAQQIWADSATRLPVRMTDYLWLSRSGDGNNGNKPITGDYDFPATGPADIYELGAPRDLQIVDDDAPAKPQVARILDAANQARQNFPTRYRAVVVQPYQGVWVEYHDAQKFRIDRFNFGMQGNFADVNQALAATVGMSPDTSILWEGDKGYLRTDPLLRGNPTIQMLPKLVYVPRDNEIDELQWEYADPRGGQGEIEMLSPSRAGCPTGDIALRQTIGEHREEYWIDPAKDYIAVNHSTSMRVDGRWMREVEDRLSNLTQTNSGHWFARQWERLAYGVPPNLKVDPNPPLVSPMDVLELDEKDFPPGIFDAAPLIQGAKKVD